MEFPKKIHEKLERRKANNALRQLTAQNNLIDFSSNDYLGFSKSEELYNTTHHYLKNLNITVNGATGSRLLSGNHILYKKLEQQLCEFHNSKSALVFNSGYNANIGFFSCVPQRGDIVLFDEYIHASIRDGISMGLAKAYKFKHNDIEHLNTLLNRLQAHTIYVVTESVFSMDGDTPNLIAISALCEKHKAYLIVDEAHAIGVFGKQGAGLIEELKLEDAIFARIITFGKAIGCHGAAILGTKTLTQFLTNFSRSLIYTTALPPHSIAIIICAYKNLIASKARETLKDNINWFKAEIVKNKLETIFIESHSAIHCCLISGNHQVKAVANNLEKQGFNIKAILAPTVPKGKERLRFCLHSYNTKQEISKVLKLFANFINHE